MNSKSTILVVDDAIENIQILTALLEEDYRIKVATNGVKALKIAEKGNIDIILLDIQMPEMDGFEVCTILQQNPLTNEIPVIFLTAKVEINNMIKGFELGAADYVTKPFKQQELTARIKTHLENKLNKEKLVAANISQQTLVHILCHDLLNSFASIQNLISMSKKNQIETDSFFEVLEAVSTNGQNLIDSVRQIRSIDEGKYELSLSNINLHNAVCQSLFLLKHLIDAKEIKISVNIEEDVYVRSEEISLINSVLNNLLTNAIKFSFRGENVNITGNKIEDGSYQLSIADKGIGIPENLSPDIFNIDKPTTRSGTEKEYGTGFGMPLVKRFMELYGGSIKIQSRDKKVSPESHGTVVFLNFRLAMD